MTLSEVCDQLETALRVAESRLQQDLDTLHADPAPFARNYDHMTPWNCRDGNGRFILLDALTALAQAKAAARE